ncbi:MAG: hypothetical protein R6U04_05810 [Bacteroidales bacterium]
MRSKQILLLVVTMFLLGCSTLTRKHQNAIDSSDKGNYNKALGLYQEILQEKPNKPKYLNDYGWTLFMVDSLEKAIETLEKAKEHSKDKTVLLERSIDRNLTIAKSYLKAREHLNKDEPQKALDALSKNKLYRSKEMELSYFGLIYEKLGEPEKAEERWETIINTYSNADFDNKFYDMAQEKMENK